MMTWREWQLTDETPRDSRSDESRFDQLCDEFERELIGGKRPPLEEFLNRVPTDKRSDLFPHLLGLELDYREQAGDSMSAQTYLTRFPEYEPVIEDLFRQFSPSAAGTSAAAKLKTLETPHQLDTYEILAECGYGGMGVVYKARHLVLRRLCALKVLRDRYDVDAAERFRQEMEHAGKLVHPNIVMVHDAGDEEHRLYLVMEYVDGCDLQRLTKEHGPLPVGAACEMVRQAAWGLRHADEHFLVHRDIKPSNLMLDSSGRVKILDFGLARFRAEQDDAVSRVTTKDGTLLGTVDFMAPEQWRNAASVTIQADIYSLGCTLFYLLTGAVPFPRNADSENALNTLIYKQSAHQKSPVPKLSEFRDDCSPELQTLLETMMAKRPEDRPQHPGIAAEHLEPFADKAAFEKLVPPPEPPSAVDNGSRRGSSRSARNRSAGQKPPSARIDALSGRRAVEASDIETGSQGATEVLPIPWMIERAKRLRRRRIMGVAAGVIATVAVVFGLFQWLGRISDSQVEMAHEYASLPGLNGGWWFDETPWFTPAARQKLFDQIHDGETQVGGVSLEELRLQFRQSNIMESYQQLEKVIDSLSAKLPAETRRRVRNLQKLAIEARQSELKDVQDALQQLQPESLNLVLNSKETDDADRIRAAIPADASAQELHLFAVMLHSMTRTNKKAEFAAALMYKQALNAYDSEPNEAPSLLALFHADYARFLNDRKQSLRSRVHLDDAEELDDSPLFRIHLACQRADAIRLADSGQVQKLLEAAADLEAVEELARETFPSPEPIEHPLQAEISERLGWLALDSWRLETAQNRFGMAAQFRERCFNAYENPFAFENWVFDRQGQAMALHFLGRDVVETSDGSVGGAVSVYQELIESIVNSLDDPSLASGQKLERRRRLPNLYERLADGYLFGPSPDYSLAAKALGDGIEQAVILQFQNSTTLWFHLTRLHCKRVIALELSAQDNTNATTDRDANAAMKKVDRLIADRTPETIQSVERYYEYEKAIAEVLRQEQSKKSTVELFELIDRVESQKVDRRNLEVILTAIRLYFERAVDPSGDDLKRVSRQLLDIARNLNDAPDTMRMAFLNPVLETAIRSLGDENSNLTEIRAKLENEISTNSTADNAG
ncbi:serine/threonine-protein kinase [Thalassoroseus pseudoceratinae]|uniref:serine/threonine-protein kinase n=1 Tax=Thalassoroseus pseudoceratinae TaxID=2713176 RepID=UPI00142321E7|nr:serine/threonine-protein kinase [Thalassoroseus pseudoceratinae]